MGELEQMRVIPFFFNFACFAFAIIPFNFSKTYKLATDFLNFTCTMGYFSLFAKFFQ